MNADIDVRFWEDDDAERADVSIRSIGVVSELRFSGMNLSAVAKLNSTDLSRIFDVLKEAEKRRIDPNPKTIEAIDFIRERFGMWDEDKSGLFVDAELVMPISSCGSVNLEPNLKRQSLTEFLEEDDGD